MDQLTSLDDPGSDALIGNGPNKIEKLVLENILFTGQNIYCPTIDSVVSVK